MKKRTLLLSIILLYGISNILAQDYWKKVGVQTSLFGGGLVGVGLKAKTTSGFAFDFGVQFSPQFMWKLATKEKNTGSSIGYFGQVDYYFTKSKVQHYALLRMGYDKIAYNLIAIGYGIEYFRSEKLSLLGEIGLGYRPEYKNVERRIEYRTNNDVTVLPVALLFKIGIVFY